MKISFIGSGYVGLVSGAVLSEIGHEVTCIDNDASKVAKLNMGKIPIYEPGLEEIVHNNLQNKRLNFQVDLQTSIKGREAIFIAVSTPSASDGSADLSYVYAAIDQLKQELLPDQIIVIKSTVPPGTGKNIQEYLQKMGLNNEVVSNPEFLREGAAIADFMNPDRIVIGASASHAAEIMKNIYKPLIDKGVKCVFTDNTTAELIKYASNSFLAVKIAFINEMANICEDINANIEDLSYGIGLDTRIGNKHLKAGPGFGGSCFPKDILAIAYMAKSLNEPSIIMEATIASNEKRKHLMVEKIVRALDGQNCNIANKTICALGLTFKADTDDVRSSPAIEILKLLLERKARIKAYDPAGSANAKLILPEIEYAATILDAAKDANCILILTEWKEFSDFDYGDVASLVKDKLIIDLRNILDKNKIIKQGYRYINIGIN